MKLLSTVPIALFFILASSNFSASSHCVQTDECKNPKCSEDGVGLIYTKKTKFNKMGHSNFCNLNALSIIEKKYWINQGPNGY